MFLLVPLSDKTPVDEAWNEITPQPLLGGGGGGGLNRAFTVYKAKDDVTVQNIRMRFV